MTIRNTFAKKISLYNQRDMKTCPDKPNVMELNNTKISREYIHLSCVSKCADKHNNIASKWCGICKF